MGAGIFETLVQPNRRPIVADLPSRDRPEQSTNGATDHGALTQRVDPGERGAGRDIRRRTAHQREHTAAACLASGHERDAAAHARDLAGVARDRAASARDLEMAQSDAAQSHPYYMRDGLRGVTGAEIVMRAATQRKRATADRAHAAEHREQAARDRAAAATDREEAARDRLRALADREALIRELAVAYDPLASLRD